MENLKVFFFHLLFSLNLFAQEYSISLWGIHIADVSIKNKDDEIRFSAQSRGIVDFLWPTNNTYSARYDSEDYSLKSWEKTIYQGNNRSSLSGKIDSNGHIIYDDKKINTQTPTHNVFTMLAMASEKEKDELDTKWFEFEHEGNTGKARFLWSETSNVLRGKDSVLCDHFRFDIIINDTTHNVKNSDYFMNNIISPTGVRELWISTSEPRQIVLAKYQFDFFTVVGQIIDD
ncbi:MAG: hypothetical protein CMG60_01780 [Candidatus Marinimicrobia bacterium]|nr:hypothetical protein [Candidatus Neomarinimicrobiota bacterium]|tara:strand:- start:11108 stop:11800 length:693 start_codon:yes stop_codon:yes gene_type:complete